MYSALVEPPNNRSKLQLFFMELSIKIRIEISKINDLHLYIFFVGVVCLVILCIMHK